MDIKYLVTVKVNDYSVENVIVETPLKLAQLIASLKHEEGQVVMGIEPIGNLHEYGEFMELLSDLNRPDELNFG